ncbi:hypothetical protein L1987_88843 [Smallanthus sonchifolius]|nr:hypothetical protein L1987_88843 [Smallanthus sonchifolius]
MDSFARCPAICCCWVEERLNPFRPGRIDCETYQELILIAGWIIGSDVISRVSTIMPRLEHEMILLAKKEGNEGPCPRTESKRRVAVRPELSRQESSETETSGTDYTDATRTDDPYRGSTSHGKNRRLMRALLQSLSGEPSADRTYCYEGKQPQWSRASKCVVCFQALISESSFLISGTSRLRRWGISDLPIVDLVENEQMTFLCESVESRAKLDTASEALRQSISIISIIEPTALSLSGLAYRSVGFYPPGVRKQRRKRSTTPANRNRNRNQNSKASNRNWYISTSNRISSGQVSTPADFTVPENQIGRKDPEDSFEAA